MEFSKAVRKRVKRTHGHRMDQANSPTYVSWMTMRKRCSVSGAYAAQGTLVCARWQDSFDAFLEDLGVRPDGTTLDRIDSSGHYEPGNCRWATAVQQSRNRRDRVLIEFNGKAQLLTDWAVETGISFSCLYARIYARNWTIQTALGTPCQKGNSNAIRKSNS